ncbi:hypothetical protein C0J52_21222 [Blattella germanica]|nr:hypothetical protein C0J52_21222 [Blattella germanica]
MKFYSAYMEDPYLNVNDSQCLILDFDPFDPRLLQYLETSKPIQCGETQPYLTYLDANGYIHFNRTTLIFYGKEERDYDCSYADVKRTNKSDFEFILGVPQVFTETERVDSSGFILVRCYSRSKKLIYETGHYYVPPPPKNLFSVSKRSIDGDISHPSILIFGLDSMSRLNFIRQLPRTFNYLSNILGAIIFKGMCKVGSNTYPNMIPFLSGRSVHSIDGKNNTVFGDGSIYYDNIPFAWYNFSAKGYVTLYTEDQPFVDQRGDKGFLNSPTDYYLRPYWLAMLSINNFRSKDYNCFGNTPKHLYHIDYTEKFAARMNNHRYFAYSFFSNLSHDDLNLVQVADADFEGMLFRMKNKGLLNNTILMFMGDHGKLYHEYRKYDIGRVEERMPFLAVVLPEKFKRKPLPKDRTCEDAGIPDDYCICARETKLSNNDTRVKRAAIDLVIYINTVLLGKTIRQGLCAPLQLSSILSAYLVSLGPKAAKPEGFRVMYRVVIEVSPSKGQFEGTIELDAWREKGRVIGDVNRLNIYGQQSHCIADKLLRFYCYCADLVTS